MTEDIDSARLVDRLIARAAGRRVIAAIAGAPGSGKSTLAETLVAALDRREAGIAAVLPMDGFHYDDQVLARLGQLPRKGGPDTFDVAGLRHTLGRLRAGDEEAVAVPLFDRSLELARAGARVIPRSSRIVVVEGNYLLLARPPWNTLAGLFDVTVLLDVPEATLRTRLTDRWIDYALAPGDIARKLDGNDLPNGRMVASESIAPDFRLRG